MKKMIYSIILLVLMVGMLVACGSEEEAASETPGTSGEDTANNSEENSANNAEENTSSNEENANETEVSGSEPQTIEFWHGMGGGLGETLDELVEQYNASQDDVEIVAEFQGSYEELLTKFRSVGGTADAPALVQVFEVGTKYMIESGYTTPVQEWIDKDGYDVSQLEENILSYYTVDGNLHSMPFNSSTPALFYNKDAFEEAGLDPENPPRTFSEIEEAADFLTVQEGGETSQFGFSMLGHGWFFEQMISTQGQDFVNEANGREGNATEAEFGGEEGQKVFEWINSMHKAGSYEYYGQNWDDIRAAFQAGQVAMYMDSSAGTKDTIANAPFDVGVAFVPHADDIDPQGVIIGGASIWMANGINEEEQAAAWEFMKYLQTAEVQADWHVNTGYFAINPAAYDEAIVTEEHEEFPELRVPIEQLQETVPSSATQGALIAVFPEARQQVVTSFEAMYQGMSPEEALNQAIEATNHAIETYNRTATEE